MKATDVVVLLYLSLSLSLLYSQNLNWANGLMFAHVKTVKVNLQLCYASQFYFIVLYIQ